MMDIKFVREHPEVVKENCRKKFQENMVEAVDQVLSLDAQWRTLKKSIDELRAQRNTLSKEISSLKKAGKPSGKVMTQAQAIPAKILKAETKAEEFRVSIDALLKTIPNIMHKDVPIGKDESENVVWKTIGKPTQFAFEVKNHAELGEQLGMMDFDSSATASGNGFYYLEGDIALLNQALINYARDSMVKNGFCYVETPLLLRGAVIENVADLKDREQQIFKIENEDLYLIGTSEHSLIGRFINTIIPEKQLPILHTSYSMCFRKEIGSHGIDEKGLYRTHQFNKIEMIVICQPAESMKHFEQMKKITIDIFKGLQIPIQVLAICSGDLGELKHIQVDIEAWSPRKNAYIEVGSCSNCTEAQARKLKIRVDGKGNRYTPHTLNNTAIATSRALVALLENHQQKDGSIKIPPTLQPYMNGKKIIKS